MDADLFSFLFNAFLFFGVVLALKDRGRIKLLINKLNHLQKVIDLQASHIDRLKEKIKELNSHKPISDDTRITKATQATTAINTPSQHQNEENTSGKEPIDSSNETISLWLTTPKNTATKSAPVNNKTTNISFESLLKGNSIFWLGAIILAIGGIFLAKYSIEAGLLPPSIRVILGSIFGLALILAAELAHKHKQRFNIHTPHISAALASGGIITCFAMAFVSFDFYSFITPNIAFALLAVIALTATYLALRFGPVLAGIGIIGSYAVPALVSTGANEILALLLYIAFVSCSAIWVAEYVKQKWLWWQSFTGHFIWFIAAIILSDKHDFWIVLCFAITSLYLYALVSITGWKLTIGMKSALTIKALLTPKKEQAGILATLVLLSAYLSLYNDFNHIVWACVIIASLVILAANKHSALDFWPFLMLAFTLYSFHLMPNTVSFDTSLFPFSNKYLFIQVSVLAGIAFSLYMITQHIKRNAYLLLLVITPISLYGISYITASSDAETYLYPVWVLDMLIISAIASYGAIKSRIELHQVSYLILANSMLTLCLTMLLSASTLTLAVVTQVASMSYLSWKYKVTLPEWLYKLALLVVVARLTLAPWTASYQDELIFSLHWTLVVYPTVLAIIWFAKKYTYSIPLKSWYTGVFIHVLALLITTETSYLLVGDYPDFTHLAYKEAILLSLNWLVLSGVYLWRSQLTSSMTQVYKTGGMLLLIGAGLIHLDITLINNPFIENHYVGAGVVNWLFLQWLVPAGVLCLFIKFKLLESQYHQVLYSIIAMLTILFINGEIRSLYNDGYIFWTTPLKQAELYSYSIVWLVISTITIFSAQYFANNHLNHAGFIGLALVTLKAFAVDMSHLEGLLRSLSFIGLGLCLVGIGWLFQKVQNKRELVTAKS